MESAGSRRRLYLVNRRPKALRFTQRIQAAGMKASVAAGEMINSSSCDDNRVVRGQFFGEVTMNFDGALESRIHSDMTKN
jgi:hypothetical protein